MKQLLAILLLCSLFACNPKTGQPAGNVTEARQSTTPATPTGTIADDKAVAMLDAFYKEYVTAYADTSSTSVQHTNEVIKKYCTPELTKKIAAASLDSDPFINAQDGDLSILKTLTVKHAGKNIYKACYTESYSNTKNCTDVTIAKVGDSYKISHVVLIEL